jgi:hypothetical protein
MKICTKCKILKSLSEFSPRNDRPCGYLSNCKVCASKRKCKSQAIFTAKMAEIKNKPCMDCGLKFPACAMDFDHRDRKTKLFSFNCIRPWKTVLIELAKCDLVCANCHRIRTHIKSKGFFKENPKNSN